MQAQPEGSAAEDSAAEGCAHAVLPDSGLCDISTDLQKLLSPAKTLRYMEMTTLEKTKQRWTQKDHDK